MTLYMFRTVFPSIISSSRLYTQQQAYVKQILLSVCKQAVSCMQEHMLLHTSQSSTITSTKCRINTVVSPDDGHIVARNMSREEINILKKIVHQVGFIYKILRNVLQSHLLQTS